MSSYRLNQNIRLTGAFWQPKRKRRIICGEVLTHQGKYYLQEAAKYRPVLESDIHDFFANLNRRSISSIDTLLGLTDKRKCTLLNLQEVSSRGVTNTEENYVVNGQDWQISTVVIGLHVSSWEEPSLDGCAFYLSDLGKWLMPPWQLDINAETHNYRFPSKLTTVIRFSSLQLRAEMSLQTIMAAQRKGSRVKAKPLIRVKLVPEKKCSLEWVMDQISKVQSLFTLLLGTSVVVRKVQLFRGADDAYVISRFRAKSQKINLQSWIKCDPNQLAFAFAKWLSVIDEERPVERIVLGMLRTSRLYTETEFLSLAQALEAFGRLRFKERVIPDQQFRAGLKAFIKSGPEFWGSVEFARRCVDALSNVNEPTFAERINSIVDLLSPELLQRVIGDRAVFDKQVRQTRNYFTHPGIKRGTSVVDGGKALFLLNRKLHALLRAVMLIDLGIPEGVIRDAVTYDASRWF